MDILNAPDDIRLYTYEVKISLRPCTCEYKAVQVVLIIVGGV